MAYAEESVTIEPVAVDTAALKRTSATLLAGTDDADAQLRKRRRAEEEDDAVVRLMRRYEALDRALEAHTATIGIHNATAAAHTASLGTSSAAIMSHSATLGTHTAALDHDRISIVAHTTSLDTGRAAVVAHVKSLDADRTAIAAHTTSLDTGRAAVMTHATSLDADRTATITHTTSLGTHTAAIDADATALTAHMASLGTHTAAGNGSRITAVVDAPIAARVPPEALDALRTLVRRTVKPFQGVNPPAAYIRDVVIAAGDAGEAAVLLELLGGWAGVYGVFRADAAGEHTPVGSTHLAALPISERARELLVGALRKGTVTTGRQVVTAGSSRHRPTCSYVIRDGAAPDPPVLSGDASYVLLSPRAVSMHIEPVSWDAWQRAPGHARALAYHNRRRTVQTVLLVETWLKLAPGNVACFSFYEPSA